MAASAATTATPPFASRQRGGEGLFALKSLASARPASPRQQRSLRPTKTVPFCGEIEDSCGRDVALDPDLLQKPEFGEPNHRRLDGCGSHAMPAPHQPIAPEISARVRE